MFGCRSRVAANDVTKETPTTAAAIRQNAAAKLIGSFMIYKPLLTRTKG
jgi:hypothetical protein